MDSFIEKWQQSWNNNIYKLFLIKPTLGEWKLFFRKSGKEHVIISRIRIGHIRLTHSNKNNQSQTLCNVKHVFIEWNFRSHQKILFQLK